jgi:hypothetical protein
VFDRILVLVSGSPGDRYALEYGIGLARSVGADTHVAGVIEIPMGAASIDEVKEVEEAGREAIEKALRAARDYAGTVGQPITTEVFVGPLGDTVCRAIESRGARLLVIGETGDAFEHGHRALVDRAPCPVFVARESIVQEFRGEPRRRTEHWEVRRDARLRIEGAGRMLQIFVGERDRAEGRPVYELIVERLRQLDIAGATVFPGELGFGAAGHLHSVARRPWSHDHPMLVTVVDTDEAIRQAIDAISPLVTNGLIVTSAVEIIKYAHRRVGTAPAAPLRV